MRRLLAVVAASLMGFAAPAFAQSAGGPVLINQTAPQATVQDNGQSALAQVPGTGTSGGVTPLLLAGGLALGAGALIFVVANQNESDTSPVSP